MPAPAIHASPYSGTWYPDKPSELAALIEELWRKSVERTGPHLLPGGRAFVVPHAGLSYSGAVAAAVYRYLEKQRPERVLLAGFAHRGAPPGIWIPDIEGFRTPLGEVAIDRALADQLAATPPFHAAPEQEICDHSVEIQLPLLQKAIPGTPVVPLYVSRLDSCAREEAARKLAGCMSPGTVLLASSDLTHFGSAFHYQPFAVDAGVADRLRRWDFEFLEAAGSLREEFFLRVLREKSSTVCGSEPIALLLATVRLLEQDGEVCQEVLDYQTSGEITGDFHHSVSYGALGYFPYTSFQFSGEEQQAILDLAKRTLAAYQQTGDSTVPVFPPSGLPSLARRAALFVTLHKHGELRGCLGRSSPVETVEQAVPELTLAAALSDSRFEPVTPSETDIDIEISILSPMKRIVQLSDFRVNEHGAVLVASGRQGLLLPQVATERNWNADQFFQALAAKTGVGAGVYSDPSTRIYVFRAQIIR
jgi:MEMO1 family protein